MRMISGSFAKVKERKAVGLWIKTRTELEKGIKIEDFFVKGVDFFNNKRINQDFMFCSIERVFFVDKNNRVLKEMSKTDYELYPLFRAGVINECVRLFAKEHFKLVRQKQESKEKIIRENEEKLRLSLKALRNEKERLGK